MAYKGIIMYNKTTEYLYFEFLRDDKLVMQHEAKITPRKQ